MAKPIWFVNLVKKCFSGRFLVARMTRIPFIGKLMDRWMFRGDRMFYLPRGQEIHIGRDLEQPSDTVLPYQIIDHFIQKASSLWIMNTCICREATGCKDYPIDLGCLFMGSAVRGIRPGLGRLVTRQEAMDHVRRAREAGLVHLVGRNKLDTLWLGVGPTERLLTVCHCCPCCCLWRVLPDLNPEISRRLTRMEGVKVEITETCTGCGQCLNHVCFVDAIQKSGHRVMITDTCRGCGRCVTVCPQKAIQLTIQGNRSVVKSVEVLDRVVDVT